MNLPPKPDLPPPVLTDAFELTLNEPVAAPPLGGEMPHTLQAALFVEPLLEGIVHHLDPVLERRVRDAIEPELARLAERVVQAARDEVAIGLRELVERAVAQELARLRSR